MYETLKSAFEHNRSTTEPERKGTCKEKKLSIDR